MHDLHGVPEAPARRMPRRHLVRLPAPAVGRRRCAGSGAAAQLDPPGV